MTRSVSRILMTVVSVGCLASPGLWAATPEADWLEGARQFDNYQGNGAVSSIGTGLRTSETYYRGDLTTQDVARGAQDRELTITLETPVYKVWTELALVTETYEEWECTRESGESRGDWHGFFSAPRREKADRLAAAIEGIGDGTAQCIVDSGAFASKPRTWSAFKTRIRRAEESCGKGIYYRVVIQYGRENARNLGYYSAEDCRLVTVEETVLKPVERKEFSHTARTFVRLSLSNAPLLQSEKELFRISYDGFKTGVEPFSRYNRYRVEASGDRYLLTGERLRTSPNNSLAIVLLPRGPGELHVTDTDYLPGVDAPQAQTFALLTIKKPIRFWPDKTLTETRLPLLNGNAIVDLGQLLGVSVAKGETYYIQYSLSRMNSRMSNDSSSAKKETPEFRR